MASLLSTTITDGPFRHPRSRRYDGRVHAIGWLGGRADASETYDPAADRWALAADLPTAFDPSIDAWTEVASSAFVHGGTPAAAAIEGRIFVAGGMLQGAAGKLSLHARLPRQIFLPRASEGPCDCSERVGETPGQAPEIPKTRTPRRLCSRRGAA